MYKRTITKFKRIEAMLGRCHADFTGGRLWQYIDRAQGPNAEFSAGARQQEPGEAPPGSSRAETSIIRTARLRSRLLTGTTFPA